MHALFGTVVNELLVSEVWVHLNLIYSWVDLGIGEQVLHLLDAHVADTNILGKTLCITREELDPTVTVFKVL